MSNTYVMCWWKSVFLTSYVMKLNIASNLYILGCNLYMCNASEMFVILG